jgi:hypothetical protein
LKKFTTYDGRRTDDDDGRQVMAHMVKLQVLGNNSKTVNNIKNLTWGKNDQHIKIYLPCNFEVNLIAHLEVS